MSISIRTYRNTDASAVCSVWNAHYADLNPHFPIDALRLELCSLAKPYFDQRQFLIAESDGRVVGFLHSGPVGNAAQTDISQTTIGVSALCVDRCEQEDAIAEALLKDLIASLNPDTNHVLFKPMPPHCAYYLGLGPADSMIGTTAGETRSCAWISACGFEPTAPTSQWEIDLTGFQAPVDRMQIQIRRSTQVNRQVDEPTLPWWQACVLGHTEPTSFQLTHRTEKRVLGEVLYWSVAPELQSSRVPVAWLWPLDVADDTRALDQLVFLIAESLRQLQAERVSVVRTVALANENTQTTILRRIGFAPTQSGMIFQRLRT